MKKIKLILALLALLPFSRAFAQRGDIIYVDFDPDTCVSQLQETLWVDFDNDGLGDIGIYYKQAQSPGYYVYIITAPGWELSIPNNENDTLTTLDNWNTFIFWNEYDDKDMFAARKSIGEKHLHAWFRAYVYLTFSPSGSGFYLNLCVDKYAFCTIPDYPLVWGQTDLWSVEEPESSAFANLYPNPTTGIVRIEGENAMEVQVFNALGQLVKTAQNANEISLEGLPQGIYLLRVTTKDGKVFSDKVVKE